MREHLRPLGEGPSACARLEAYRRSVACATRPPLSSKTVGEQSDSQPFWLASSALRHRLKPGPLFTPLFRGLSKVADRPQNHDAGDRGQQADPIVNDHVKHCLKALEHVSTALRGGRSGDAAGARRAPLADRHPDEDRRLVRLDVREIRAPQKLRKALVAPCRPPGILQQPERLGQTCLEALREAEAEHRVPALLVALDAVEDAAALEEQEVGVDQGGDVERVPLEERLPHAHLPLHRVEAAVPPSFDGVPLCAEGAGVDRAPRARRAGLAREPEVVQGAAASAHVGLVPLLRNAMAAERAVRCNGVASLATEAVRVAA
mmetsp:Transcript_46701/g.131393  ORF Transcript_46701/g.131393 Transcript_46701/m.131393 type:complete len:319 (-) Transcript_46701:817-1773(-)